ncbi:hypothetical protein E4V01_21935 [Methylorubrum sp. Q1]|uniref:hypothetical protein n=1 Tax=Methylorubrum sp. Q1 TaxID=2562453 RepID=UPI00107623E4|nr:hypothetical protein [Methylorubrum sp. Q1]TFZ55586.1 hypothetical protein E4V01_21935 [Methylorubrum sp. Q1]
MLAERRRQVEAEGWTPAHDDAHGRFELASAASCYAVHAQYVGRDQIADDNPPAWWPWDRKWWKPADRRRDLVKAGALILAEVERLDRATPPSDPAPSGQAETFPKPHRKDGEPPCGECYLNPGETCDICGAIAPSAPSGQAEG